MKDKIEEKIKELIDTKDMYLSLIENSNGAFEESYLLGKVKECRDKIDVLVEVLEDE